MSIGDKKALFILTVLKALAQSEYDKDENNKPYSDLLIIIEQAVQIYFNSQTKKLPYGYLSSFEKKLKESFSKLDNYEFSPTFIGSFVVYVSEYLLFFLKDFYKVDIWNKIHDLVWDGTEILNPSAKEWFDEIIESLKTGF